MADQDLIFEEWTEENEISSQEKSTPTPDAEESTPVEGSEAAQPAPAWFQKKQAAPAQAQPVKPSSALAETPARTRLQKRRIRKARKPLIVVVPEADEVEDLPWSERFQRWLHSVASASVGVSLVAHTLLLLIMALIVYNTQPERPNLGLTGSEGVELNPEEFLEIGEIEQAEDEESGASELAETPVIDIDTTADLSTNIGVEFKSGDLFKGMGSGNGNSGKGLSFSLKPGKNAVIKGSFTAWTVPEDPLPGQNYRIFITIKVPDSITKYPLDDLRGSFVIGTDGYFKSIPERGGLGRVKNTFAKVHDGEVTLAVDIPGASQLVKDTIKVESKLLKEKQQLEITF